MHSRKEGEIHQNNEVKGLGGLCAAPGRAPTKPFPSLGFLASIPRSVAGHRSLFLIIII